jgi:hypothetical protein
MRPTSSAGAFPARKTVNNKAEATEFRKRDIDIDVVSWRTAILPLTLLNAV